MSLATERERRRRADSKLTDAQIRVLHRVHDEREVSIRELGRLIADEAGFASSHAAGRAICRGFARLHLPARSAPESRLATIAKGYRRCEEIRSNGGRCEGFSLPGLTLCWSHEFREAAQENALRNSPFVERAAA